MHFISFCRSATLLIFSFVIVGFPTLLLADNQWARYKWEGNNLDVVNKMSSNWNTHIDIALDDWDRSILNLTISPGLEDPSCSPEIEKTIVCSGSYGDNGWLGIANIWVIKGKEIVQATTRVNDTYLREIDEGPYGGFYNSDAWRQLVACQEVGHDWGLAHQDEDFDNTPLGTCMDYTSNPADNQHPNDHDYDQLAEMYSESGGGGGDTKPCNPKKPGCNSGAAMGAMPPAMNDIDFAGPGQWGRLVARSVDGHQEVYELDFGHGYKVLTHVTWVESMGPAFKKE